MTHYAIFETTLGHAALVWGDLGLVGVRLPASTPERARAEVFRRFSDAAEAPPPPGIAGIAEAVADLLAGGRPDLSGAALDLARVPAFNAKVYEIARAIPAGETLTYGEIAIRLGDRLLARDVGRALGENPWPIVVPCHRVTAAGGRLGGFSAPGGAATKARLLEIEGAAVVAQTSLFA